jgi:site-specific DNA-methyltransferase (adenine-specific)
MGSGTTAISCIKNGRDYVGFELNENYCKIIENRIENFAASKKIFNNQQVFNFQR